MRSTVRLTCRTLNGRIFCGERASIRRTFKKPKMDESVEDSAGCSMALSIYQLDTCSVQACDETGPTTLYHPQPDFSGFESVWITVG